jgi:hypothetical protein
MRKTRPCPYADCRGGTVQVWKTVWVKGKRMLVIDYENCPVCGGRGEVAK